MVLCISLWLRCWTPDSRLDDSLICCRKVILMFFHSFWWTPHATRSLSIPCFEEVSEEFVLLCNANSSKQGSEMMMWIWFYSGKGPWETRAWRWDAFWPTLLLQDRISSAWQTNDKYLKRSFRANHALYGNQTCCGYAITYVYFVSTA